MLRVRFCGPIGTHTNRHGSSVSQGAGNWWVSKVSFKIRSYGRGDVSASGLSNPTKNELSKRLQGRATTCGLRQRQSTPCPPNAVLRPNGFVDQAHDFRTFANPSAQQKSRVETVLTCKRYPTDKSLEVVMGRGLLLWLIGIPIPIIIIIWLLGGLHG